MQKKSLKKLITGKKWMKYGKEILLCFNLRTWWPATNYDQISLPSA